MKRIFLLLVAVTATMFQSCDGDTGPQGVPGPAAEVFEVTTDFVPTNDPETSYRKFFDLNPAIYQSDNVLVYQLSGVVDGKDVWKLLPQVYTFDNGDVLQYNYDFSYNDFSIFIDANFNLNTLPNTWFNNKTFRVVIVPGYFSSDLNLENMDVLLSQLKVSNEQIIQL